MTPSSKYVLDIYIAGMTPVARTAVRNLEQVCRTLNSESSYKINVIDVEKHPELAEQELILATPTVIRRLPPPIRRIVGDLSEHEQVLVALELETESDD